MTRKVWKYGLMTLGENEIELPEKAILVHVDCQGEQDVPTLWFEVEDTNSFEYRVFSIFATGQPIPDVYNDHVGSVLTNGASQGSLVGRGAFVWHVYERAYVPDPEYIAFEEGILAHNWKEDDIDEILDALVELNIVAFSMKSRANKNKAGVRLHTIVDMLKRKRIDEFSQPQKDRLIVIIKALLNEVFGIPEEELQTSS